MSSQRRRRLAEKLTPEGREIYFQTWLAAKALERLKRGHVTYIV